MASNGTAAVFENSVPVPVPSPVSWHVAFWALLALAANSMAQQSAFTNDHRFYAHCSPLICATETALDLLRIGVVSITLSISPSKSIRLNHQLNHDRLPPKRQQYEIRAPYRPHSWPRWLFFIIGTVPASIKLGSFSGLPWTKAWGFMFLFSFVANEITTVFSRSCAAPNITSVAEILGHTSIDWSDIKHDRLKYRIYRLDRMLDDFQSTVKYLVRWSNILLLIWGSEKLWLAAYNALLDSHQAQTVIKIFSISTLILQGLSIPADRLLRRPQYQWALDPYTKQSYLGRVTWPLALAGMLAPKEPVWNWSENGQRVWRYITVIIIPFYISGWFEFGMIKLCERFPVVGEALYIIYPLAQEPNEEQRALLHEDSPAADSIRAGGSRGQGNDVEKWQYMSELDEITNPIDSQDIVDGMLLTGLATGTLVEDDHLEEVAGKSEIEDEEDEEEEKEVQPPRAEPVHLEDTPNLEAAFAGTEKAAAKEDIRVQLRTNIDLDAWNAFCFFIQHMLVCVLWYAFKYDEAGTINPNWTEVLG